ncbi:hypothetical protein AgCh_028773 [Apium graveolens]
MQILQDAGWTERVLVEAANSWGQRLVSCYSKKHQSVLTSTAKAKYIAAGSCCAQVLWIKNQLMNYGLVLQKIPIMCDNTSAIFIVVNPINHSRIKHIDVRYHFIREHAVFGTIELIYVPAEKQLADIFTKPLDEATFTRLGSDVLATNIDDNQDVSMVMTCSIKGMVLEFNANDLNDALGLPTKNFVAAPTS